MTELEPLNSGWVYTRDRKKFLRRGLWHVLRPDADGKYRGDCEDYSLTALYYLSGKDWGKFWKAIWTFKAAIVHCKSPSGGGHAVLRYKSLYIDNIQQQWYTKQELEGKGYKFGWLASYTPVFVAFQLMIGKIRR